MCVASAVVASFAFSGCGPAATSDDGYVVLASRAVASDAEWMAVAEALAAKHSASLHIFETAPREALATLRAENPRWVAVVEMPENLNRDYVIDAHALSREIDDDIYADYLWGVVSGYDAASAMRMVVESTEPLVVKSAVATIMETNSAKWFDRYGYVDDHTPGLWGEKTAADQPVVRDSIDPRGVLRKFTDLYEAYDPDMIITAAHATQRNLEMPFSLGNLRPRDGRLYADSRINRGRFAHDGGEEWNLAEGGNTSEGASGDTGNASACGSNTPKRKVYLAVGNCLIGDFDGSRESMAPAWISGHNAVAMSGYVVTTWHGRNGWGGLKYLLTTPGRHTVAEAIYLNQQDMLHQFNEWAPTLIREPFDYDGYMNADETDFDLESETFRRLTAAVDGEPTADQLGFWHDRDVLVYYGDPKWDVRLQQIAAENDFVVTASRDGDLVTVTVETSAGFSPERMAGDGFKQEHVLDLPFSHFFAERLENPRLAPGQEWNAAVDENFLLVYDPGFEPGRKYTIVLQTGK